jgi:hypothetical protein
MNLGKRAWHVNRATRDLGASPVNRRELAREHDGGGDDGVARHLAVANCLSCFFIDEFLILLCKINHFFIVNLEKNIYILFRVFSHNNVARYIDFET